MIEVYKKPNIFRLFFRAGDYPALEWIWPVLLVLLILTVFLIGF